MSPTKNALIAHARVCLALQKLPTSEIEALIAKLTHSHTSVAVDLLLLEELQQYLC